MPIEVLENPQGKPGVEKVNIVNGEWADSYCGFHVHELRYHTDVPYLVLTAASTEYFIYMPIDFMFKLVKAEFLHTTVAGVDEATHVGWRIERSRELMGSQVWTTIIGGDTGPTSDWLVEFNDRYIYPPTNLRFSFIGYGGALDEIWPSLTLQVTY
jgi:hypothetical protein